MTINNMMHGATSTQFANWQEHAATCCNHSLRHIIDDCRAAEIAMRGWNPSKEAYYADQKWTYMDELRRRKCPTVRAYYNLPKHPLEA